MNDNIRTFPVNLGEAGVRHVVTKTFGHELGLSCVFRQWRADHSHCQYLHGYALAFSFTFEASELDERGWVVDFGGLAGVRSRLKAMFDHTLVVAKDDPLLDEFTHLAAVGGCDLRVTEAVGCEAFARIGLHIAAEEIDRRFPRVTTTSCTVSEHGSNRATARIA